MKTIILGLAAFLFAFNSQAQNENTKSEVKTTVTTIKDSDGQKEIIKTQDVKEIQNIELKDADSNSLNKEVKATPVNVIAVTKVSEDGITKVVDIDRSNYYNLNGKKYQISNDKGGYTMYYPDGKKSAILRKTSNNNYIYRTNTSTSYGYFDADGNLKLETYDPKTDQITITTYTIIKQ